MMASKLIFQFCVFTVLYNCFTCSITDNKIKKYSLNNMSLKNSQTPYELIENLRKQVLAKEKELKKAEEINRNFEKMLQLVNILGQVDSFLTDRTKVLIKKIAMLVDADDGKFEREFNNNHGITIQNNQI
ncbi:uncharacterized protein LOC130900494 [Diorhabda carinulata]|uniref:uncharacterized protein LOC130453165 n=1 Tax=Diorhabda sublineata TaxID=1163346 RepID=UPI0024E0EDEF|nr:uncharacterized protein LOC130453165 [Diorhabda sublineata]XP_057667132.1 uncharacterized protein LOC130900494 [Diorhabda carinulata]